MTTDTAPTIAELLQGININYPHRDPYTQEMRHAAPRPTSSTKWLAAYFNDRFSCLMYARATSKAKAFAFGGQLYKASGKQWEAQ